MADEAQHLYRDDTEVEEVVLRFESCEFPPDDFNHRPHLTVALCYLLRSSDTDALGRLRMNLARYIKAHGITPTLYHETITAFWLKRVRGFIERAGASRPLAELANELSDECSDSRLVFQYYSKELIDSESARRGWVEPDLRPLDF
ncbi:MAG: hypothetical protein H7Z38_13550 [Rubrivivax sp.]|nr:hypothetical protein [Pyrinomonadaceae bacterium]